ncbi:hypothetical protein D3C74_252200 [compost metagenome]
MVSARTVLFPSSIFTIFTLSFKASILAIYPFFASASVRKTSDPVSSPPSDKSIIALYIKLSPVLPLMIKASSADVPLFPSMVSSHRPVTAVQLDRLVAKLEVFLKFTFRKEAVEFQAVRP